MKKIPQRLKTEYIIQSAVSDEKEVFYASKPGTDDKYVIKCIDSADSGIYNFLKTAKPEGVPEIIDVIEEDGDDIFIVEKFIDGDTLTEYVEKKKSSLTESWVRGFVLNICRTLMYIHGLNPPIIHRDIKPDNIIISNDRDVYLIDFNISRFYVNKSERGETSRDTLIMGTVDFAAPEQFGFMESDARTDIYGLGATIQFILDKTGIESSRLEEVIKKCKQFSPGDRYQSAAEIMSQLSEDSVQRAVQMHQTDEMRQIHSARHENIVKYSKYAPPGFRSGNLLKMVVALLGYILCFALALMLETNTEGIPGEYELFYIWLNKATALIALLMIIIVSTNYADVQKFLFKNAGNISTVKKIVYIILADIAVFVLMAAVPSIIGIILKK